MRTLKLVIWDLDDTILNGVLEEGDIEINAQAYQLMQQLNKQGILQALATQNPNTLISTAPSQFEWFKHFVQIEADLGPKKIKVERILQTLDISPLDTVFIDEDPFERDSILAQINDITASNIAGLALYLQNDTSIITREAQHRPQMYQQNKQRVQHEEKSDNHLEFLRSCNIQITIRAYQQPDKLRIEELLKRTNRMNLGSLPVASALTCLDNPQKTSVVIAELKDVYGDMGRVAVAYFTPVANGQWHIDSLAISCRTQARGLSLAILIGLCRFVQPQPQQFSCSYLNNGANRPLRMLLMAIGFKPTDTTGELSLSADRLAQQDLPDWVTIKYLPSILEVN